MNVNSATKNLWPIQPTSLERKLGRLLRSPEGHEENNNSNENNSNENNNSLVNEDENNNSNENNDENQNNENKNENKDENNKAPEPLTAESLTIPEGFEVQPELSEKFLEILNGDMSPQDRANALLALHGETLTSASEANSKAWEDMQTEWKEEAKGDPDIGGAKLQPTLAGIGKLLNEFGNEEVRNVFNLTGAGNNVHIIKFLDKIANVLTEGQFFKAGSPGGADEPDAAAKRMFPSMKG